MHSQKLIECSEFRHTLIEMLSSIFKTSFLFWCFAIVIMIKRFAATVKCISQSYLLFCYFVKIDVLVSDWAPYTFSLSLFVSLPFPLVFLIYTSYLIAEDNMIRLLKNNNEYVYGSTAYARLIKIELLLQVNLFNPVKKNNGPFQWQIKWMIAAYQLCHTLI